ncbi:MAG: Restriction endonuclease [Segetibacter sp.]|nr:Restriction endonuclease [Segetibacter sp.]
MKAQRISTQALMALKDALSNLYWKKEDLKKFVELTIQNSAIVATIDWTVAKFESVSLLIDRMAANQNLYQNDLLLLLREVGNFEDFSHLAYWDKDKGGQLTERAKEAVSKLRIQTKGYFDAIEEVRTTEVMRNINKEKIQSTISFAEKLRQLYNDFLIIATNTNAQARGYQLEKLLNALFHLFDLEAKGPYKIIGEQIDGSFSFDSQDYLLEAKWQKDPVDAGELYKFGTKIDGKFKSTVGLFISLDGFSNDCTRTSSSIIKSMILMDGQDLMMVLDGRIRLNDLIMIKRRHASDTGEIYYKVL